MSIVIPDSTMNANLSKVFDKSDSGVIWVTNPCDIYYTPEQPENKQPTKAEIEKIAEQIFEEMTFNDDNFMPIGFIVAEPDKRGYIRVPSTKEELEKLWHKMEVERDPRICVCWE